MGLLSTKGLKDLPTPMPRMAAPVRKPKPAKRKGR